jgi:hypothetical protein
LKSKETLARSKEGKNTMRVVCFETYERDVNEWRKLLQRQDKASAMLAELTEFTDGAFEKTTKHNRADSNNKDDIDRDDFQTKSKRRRKRSGKLEVIVGEDGEITRITKKKKQATKITF